MSYTPALEIHQEGQAITFIIPKMQWKTIRKAGNNIKTPWENIKPEGVVPPAGDEITSS